MADDSVMIVNASDLYINPSRKVPRTMRERWLGWPWRPWRSWKYEPAIKITVASDSLKERGDE